MSRNLNGNWRRGAATPNRVARLVVPEPTYPAVFAVKPILAPNAFTTFPRLKITRPGVVLLAGGDNRENGPLTYPVEFQLHRLARPVPRRIRRLVMKSDGDGQAHFVLRDVAGERASDFPMLDRAPWDGSSPFFTQVDAGLRLNRAPDAGQPIRLQMVAHGLPGWKRGERRVPPPPPKPYHAGLTQAEQARGSFYDTREPLEIWLFLSQEDRDNVRQAHDSALFTVAPFIIGGEIDAAEVLFAVYLPDTGQEIGNFGTAYEMAASADAAGIHSVFFGADAHEDVFAQDAAMLGYSVNHTDSVDVVVLTNRRKQTRLNARHGLEAVAGTFAANNQTILFPEMCDELESRNTMDYGGNVLVSPPVARSTKAVDEGDAGPAVPAQPAAPYGKIVLGDSGDSDVGRPTGAFRDFLRAQRAQPVVPIDTAWLHVRHADEIVTFVRAPNPQNTNNGPSGFCMLVASPHLAVQLMLKAERIRFLTAARWKVDLRDYTINAQRFGTPLDANAHTWITKLAAIESRLLATLRLRRQGDLIRVPVLFTPGNADAAARMPNMVNLVSLGDTVIVPKPFGPRVPPLAAAGILKALPGQGITQGQIDGTNMLSLLNDYHWVNTTRPETWQNIYRPIQNEVCVLQPGDDLSGDQYTWPAGADQVPDEWEKWTFNPTRIDLFQAYMYVQLSALGLNVRFVDDWYWYHRNEGELHCGSKVRHAPPAIADGSRWWQNWEALLAYEDAI
jgi:hypothetical protein